MKYDGSNTSWILPFLEGKFDLPELRQMKISNETMSARTHNICKCSQCGVKFEYETGRGYWFYPEYINHREEKKCPKCEGKEYKKLS